MSYLVIIGNGFDIAHGIPTKYSDFRSYIIESFPQALELKDEIVLLEDFENIDTMEFSAEILLNTMDKTAGEYWSNFEDALAYINFNNKFPLPNHKDNETDEEDDELMKVYLLYMDVVTSGFINCSRIWQEFFRTWIKEIEIQIERRQYTSKDNLKNLFSIPGGQFLSFNYTKTLQLLYGVKKVIHIHNRVGQKLIWGHGESNIMYDPYTNKNSVEPYISSSFLNDMILSFKKDTVSPMKKYNDFFKRLSPDINEVYSYGFGYGKVDCVYIKEIIQKVSPNTTWYFTKYEAQNSNELRIKKIKLRRYGFKGTFGLYEG